MLFAYPVINRKSYDLLNGYFTGAIHELDAACGRHISLTYIGDPELNGEIHRSQRSAKLARSDLRDSREYVKRLDHPGWEKHHRLGEMMAYRRLLHLSEEDIPGIAFLSRSGKRPVGLLRFAPGCFASLGGTDILDQHLRAFLSRDDVVKTATSGLSDLILERRLNPMVEDLTREIASAVGRPGSYWTPGQTEQAAPDGVVIVLRPSHEEVIYKGLSVDLTRAQFRLLRALAEGPGRFVLRDDLLDKADEGNEWRDINVIKWAKNHKHGLLQSLLKLVGRNGITEDEIDGLVTAGRGRLRLNLAPVEVRIL